MMSIRHFLFKEWNNYFYLFISIGFVKKVLIHTGIKLCIKNANNKFTVRVFICLMNVIACNKKAKKNYNYVYLRLLNI